MRGDDDERNAGFVFFFFFLLFLTAKSLPTNKLVVTSFYAAAFANADTSIFPYQIPPSFSLTRPLRGKPRGNICEFNLSLPAAERSFLPRLCREYKRGKTLGTDAGRGRLVSGYLSPINTALDVKTLIQERSMHRCEHRRARM
jgi:hypothetical protein